MMVNTMREHYGSHSFSENTQWTKIQNNRHSPLFRFSLKAYISRILRCIMYRRG